jgi:hypothetical protein
MENTYTYTARSAENPDHIVTFTLHDDQMTVSVAAPLEQVEQMIAKLRRKEDEGAEETDDSKLWLKPLAVSLVERGTGSFNIEDVSARLEGEVLLVRAWVRLGGLRGSPITLFHERVDNLDAADAFVWEVDARKEQVDELVLPLDYWLTWLGLAAGLFFFFVVWRRRRAQARHPAFGSAADVED